MAAEQSGSGKVCKTGTTGSIPAFASNYMQFIEVMQRDNPKEMLDLMRSYYHDTVTFNAHNMVRLGLSIVVKYEDLHKRCIELSKENSKLRRTRDSEDK